MLNEVISNLNATQAVGLMILLSAYYCGWMVILTILTEDDSEKLWEYIYLASPLGIGLVLLIFG